VNDLVVIAESKEELIKKLNRRKHGLQGKGMKVNINKSKVMISGKTARNTQYWKMAMWCLW